LNRDRGASVRSLIGLVTDVSKEQLIRYVLTLFDDMLQEDKSRVEILHQYSHQMNRSTWSFFQGVFARNDRFIINQMASIFAKLACFGTTRIGGREINFYFNFLINELKTPNNEYVNTSARCLQMMLRFEEYRAAFIKTDGVATIMSVLNGKTNFQLQYQLIFLPLELII